MKNNCVLLILAAGLSTRYGSLKQLDSISKYGETLIDYAIYDVINSGFKKVIFVIREEFFESFKYVIELRWKNKIELEYVFQSMQVEYNGKIVSREKPWGTAHALLAAKKNINEPFCVINGDDFYGRESFKKIYEFLNKKISSTLYCLIGYKLENTLSKYGFVSRGLCSIDYSSMLLKKVDEKKKIYKKGNKIFCHKNQFEIELDSQIIVSMNFWGLHPDIFKIADIMFSDFLVKNIKDETSEFFLPDLVTYGINQGIYQVQVIPTSNRWFGITYKKDKQEVFDKINQLIEKKFYPEIL